MNNSVSAKRCVLRFKLLTGLCIGLFSLQGQASGFRLPEISTTGMGLSNALVANKDEAGAMGYNPAIMAFQEDHTFQIGTTIIGYDLSVTPTGGSKTDSTTKNTFFVPNTMLTARTSDDVTFGLALNSPFGLETRWPKDTFPTFTGAADGSEPEHSKIAMLNVNPNLAIKLDNKTSVAIGIMYYDVDSLVFNLQSTRISGKGNGYGWNIAMLHTTKNWNFGLSYKSSVKANLKGSLTSTGTPLPAAASLEFPDLLQLGVLYRINDKFNVEFDIEHTGWSVFDQIVIEYNTTTGKSSLVSVNNWKDSLSYRLGASYQLSDQTRLRFGYSLDDTPQPEATFSARIPDNDRQLFSIGVGHDFGGWMLDAAFMHVIVDDRTVTATTYYNGTYTSDINLIGLGISTTF